MAVIKLSKSGKALLFIADDGTVYIAPKAMVQSMCDGSYKKKMFLLGKMPIQADLSRFEQSKVWGDAPSHIAGRDAFDYKHQKANEQKKSFEDKDVW